MPETKREPRIQSGQRVRCEKQGPWNGKIGEVEDVWMGQALVYIEKNAVCEPLDYFAPVQA